MSNKKVKREKQDSVSPFMVSEVELIYKTKIKASDRFSIISSKDPIKLFRQVWDDDKIELQEECKVMLLNNAHKVLGICSISAGGLTSTIVDLRLILSIAIKGLAKGIIVAHNHPSGNLTPSKADIEFSKKLKMAAELFDMDLLDSMIIAKEGYYSFADEGIL